MKKTNARAKGIQYSLLEHWTGNLMKNIVKRSKNSKGKCSRQDHVFPILPTYLSIGQKTLLKQAK